MFTITTNAAPTPLRQRMQHDMMLRGLGQHTQQDYIPYVKRFAVFVGRPPDTATSDDIRRYQLDQHEQAVSPSTINGAVSALRFLFSLTLGRRDLARSLMIIGYRRKLPDVLSLDVAARLLQAAAGMKYKAALGVAYGAGLRVSEVAHLKVDDIDSTRMLIRIEQGKGRKDRNAMLSPQVLELLRMCWREAKNAVSCCPMASCSPDATTPIPSRPGSCTAQCRRPLKWLASASASARKRYAIALRPTCSSRMLTSASFMCFLGTASSRRPRFTQRCRLALYRF